MYFVYILQSLRTGRFYIGHCNHLIRRFHEHQAGLNQSTKGRGPWWMPYYEICQNRVIATARERLIKQKNSAKSIHRIIKRGLADL